MGTNREGICVPSKYLSKGISSKEALNYQVKKMTHSDVSQPPSSATSVLSRPEICGMVARIEATSLKTWTSFL